MGKCEWKDGILNVCDARAVELRANVTLAEENYPFCKWCGADIREPEPEKPLIIKSGGTWVAHWKGVDYLCVKTFPYDFEVNEEQFLFQLKDRPGTWKSFSEIEKEGLTDEIALLRPMVCGGIQKYTLYGVLKEEGITWLLISDTLNDIEWYDNRLNDFRLATPHELQEK